MAIRESSSKQIDTLIADLSATNAVTRETAIARLTLIGARAVERLLAYADSAGEPEGRAAAWRTLEAIGDPRALEPALQTLADPQADAAVGAAAIGVGRSFIKGPRGAAVVDRLTSVVLDRGRPEPLRIGALRALRELNARTIAPLLKSLANEPSDAIRSELDAARKKRRPESPEVVAARAAEEGLADDPGALRTAVSHSGDGLSLALLLRIVERVREREGAEPAAKRDEWRLARAAAHVAMASRGSRLALYDLRESFEGASSPLPVEFLNALAQVGDASCLEAIAVAHAKARDSWWREQLTRAFRDIVAAEGLTRRHAVLRRVEKRSPGALDQLLG